MEMLKHIFHQGKSFAELGWGVCGFCKRRNGFNSPNPKKRPTCKYFKFYDYAKLKGWTALANGICTDTSQQIPLNENRR